MWIIIQLNMIPISGYMYIYICVFIPIIMLYPTRATAKLIFSPFKGGGPQLFAKLVYTFPITFEVWGSGRYIYSY